MNNIISHKFADVLCNLIKKHINFSFNNYTSFIQGIDEVFNKAVVSTITTILEEMDLNYKYSSTRKSSYHIKINNVPRTIVTLWGAITYKRTWYVDKYDKKTCYCYVDRYLAMPKKDIYDPCIKSIIIDYSASHSAPKTAEIVEDMIGLKFKFKELVKRVSISRQMVRNIINKFAKVTVTPDVKTTPDTLYIMADEKWVSMQNNNGKDKEIKLAVCFDKYNKTYKSRTKLDNKHYISSIDGVDSVRGKLLDYIYSTYDTDKIKKVVLMGDGANWIKNTTRDLKFNSSTKVIFALDHFHFKQALLHISKDDVYSRFILKYVYNNTKTYFIKIVDLLISKFPHRKDTLEKKRNYILNNWNYIQTMINNATYKCSMEGHISHVLADLFASRPKGYSLETLEKLLNLRILKKNGYDLRKIYLNNFNKRDDEIVLDNADILDYDSMFRNMATSNIPVIAKGNKGEPMYTVMNSIAHPCAV